MTHNEKIMADLLTALKSISVMIEDLPSGIDRDADGENPSPEDAAAHIGGLIWQIATAAINKTRST